MTRRWDVGCGEPGNYERSVARDPSDVLDEQWALIELHLRPERNRSLREISRGACLLCGKGANQARHYNA